MRQGMHGQQADDVIGRVPDGEQSVQVSLFQGIVVGVFSILGGVKYSAHSDTRWYVVGMVTLKGG